MARRLRTRARQNSGPHRYTVSAAEYPGAAIELGPYKIEAASAYEAIYRALVKHSRHWDKDSASNSIDYLSVAYVDGKELPLTRELTDKAWRMARKSRMAKAGKLKNPRSTDHAAEFSRGWEDGEQAFDLSMSPGAPEILTRAQLRRSHSEAYSKGYLAAVHEGEGDLDEYIELEGSEPSPNPRKSQWYEVLWDDGEEQYRETLTAPSFRAAVTESQSLIRRIAGTPGGTLLLAQEMDDGAMMFEVSGVPGVYAALVSKIRTPTLKPEGRRGAAPAWLHKMRALEQKRNELVKEIPRLRSRRNPFWVTPKGTAVHHTDDQWAGYTGKHPDRVLPRQAERQVRAEGPKKRVAKGWKIKPKEVDGSTRYLIFYKSKNSGKYAMDRNKAAMMTHLLDPRTFRRKTSKS